MKKGKCKLRYFAMFIFTTIEGFSAELLFGTNTVFEYEEQENGNILLKRKGMTLTIPKKDFWKMTIITEEEGEI